MDPLASSPYPKAFRVSTSEEFQPSRCGASNQARLKPRINRALTASSTFVLAIRNTTVTFPQLQGFFLPPINISRNIPGHLFFSPCGAVLRCGKAAKPHYPIMARGHRVGPFKQRAPHQGTIRAARRSKSFLHTEYHWIKNREEVIRLALHGRR